MSKRHSALKQRDQDIGFRIRKIRTINGISQKQLAEYLGITFQQVQKYEKGTNRVSASRLEHIADILNVQISDFYHHTGDKTYDLSSKEMRLIAASRQLNSEKIISATISLLEQCAEAA